MNDYAIEVHGLTKRFGERTALADLDLTVPRRSVFGFLGPNGAGKTTLIRLLLGLTRPSEGSMRLLGASLPEERSTALARVGAIVEEPRFHRFLTGRENLAIAAAARSPEAQARIEDVLARVGMSDRADDRVKSYSLGMRQRLGVARALLADPELLILDEPTNGLDPAGIHEFRRMIRQFVEDGMTVLLSSHLLDEVEKVADYVAIVDQGRVVLQGSVTDLYAETEHTILVTTSRESEAMAVLVLDAVVCAAERTPDGIRVTLRPGLDA
jgi:ABC-2 type transport system ATP-binding protein